VKYKRSSIMEKKSIVFAASVTMCVEILLIMILMELGTYMLLTTLIQNEKRSGVF
jgi:hypothetical protein